MLSLNTVSTVMNEIISCNTIEKSKWCYFLGAMIYLFTFKLINLFNWKYSNRVEYKNM